MNEPLYASTAIADIYPEPTTIQKFADAFETHGGVPPSKAVLRALLDHYGYQSSDGHTFYHWKHLPDGMIVDTDDLRSRIQKLIATGAPGVSPLRIQLTELVDAVNETCSTKITWRDVADTLDAMGWYRTGRRFIKNRGSRIIWEPRPDSVTATKKLRKTAPLADHLRDMLDTLGLDEARPIDLAPEIARRGISFNDNLRATFREIGWTLVEGTSNLFRRPVEGVD